MQFSKVIITILSNKMMRLFVIASILIIPAFIVSAAADEPVTEPFPLILWASSDPKEDSQVSKVDSAKFARFIIKYRKEFMVYYNSFNIIGATKFLKDHAKESGSEGVNWVPVFIKIVEKKLTGVTEEKEHGLASLVAWTIRNTGPGTNLTSVDRDTLTSYILDNKNDVLKYQRSGDVDGLINYLQSTSTQSKSTDVDWKTVINYLKDNRQLFKSSCGLFKLRLCNNIKN